MTIDFEFVKVNVSEVVKGEQIFPLHIETNGREGHGVE
jgi:hypothetical protein